MQFKIPEANMQKMEEKLKTIEKKCAKYGCNYHFEIIGEEYQDIQYFKEVIGGYGQSKLKLKSICKEKLIIVDVTGKAIIDNWEYLATLEHTENGNIIRTFSEITIPEVYKTIKANCDHCNINRYRKDSYLIRNLKTNEIKQVGKSCLKEYTGGLSAEHVAALQSYFNTVEKIANELYDHVSNKRYIDVTQYLMIANAMINKYGFTSKTKSEEYGLESTIAKISDYMSGKKYQELIIDDDNNIKLVENMLSWLTNQDDQSNRYISNLKIACLQKYAEYRDCGILASLPSAYFKAMDYESKKQTENEQKEQCKSEYYGNVGDKITLKNVEIMYLTSYETQYGYTHIFKISDQEGHVFVWKTNKRSVETIEDNECKYIEIEKYRNIKGSIKTHNEYKGEKQTELTRCKVF